MTELEDELRAFVEPSVGAPVTSLERTAVGSARVTLLVEVEDAEGRARAPLLRQDSRDGPLSATDIDLASG